MALVLKEKDIDSFFRAPMECYPLEFPFVSQLKSDLDRFLSLKNPLFKTAKDFSYWTAFEGDKIVGRIVTHIHHASNDLYKMKRSYFGFFDCINDINVARALLKKAEDFAKLHGCYEVVGNFNLTAMQQAGVVTKILENRHYTDQVFAPEYVAGLLKECGYSAFFPMTTFEVDVENFDAESLLGPKQRELMKDESLKYEKLRWNNFSKMMEATRICLNDGFEKNPMFVPLTKDELFFQAQDMMIVVDKETSIITYKGDRPLGALICIPNLNPFLKAVGSKLGFSAPYHLLKMKMNRESAVIIFYSVVKDYQNLGLNGLMLYKMMKALKARGYKKFGGTWIADENTASLAQARKLNGKEMHKLHLFKKDI